MASTAGGDNVQTMVSTISLTKSKRHPHLWLHQTVSLDVQSTAPSILIQPSTPPVNLYKRVTGSTSRLRSKSGEEGQIQGAKPAKSSSGKLTDLSTGSLNEEKSRSAFFRGALPEEGRNDEKSAYTNGNDFGAVGASLPSPTKRVTFLEHAQRASNSLQQMAIGDEKADRKRQPQPPPPPARRVRKSKTLDAVIVNPPSDKPPHSPRSPVMDFFNQIRAAPNAPRKAVPTLAGVADPTTLSSNSSNRPRSFTLGFRTFANFRHPQQQQPQSQSQPQSQEGRKSSRQSFRNVEGKEKRKRTRSYSFRAPTWLNVNKPKIEQSNLLRPDPPMLKPIIRKRSISANNLNLLIMRQTSSEPEIMGTLHRHDDNAILTMLSTFSCYDLMPQQGVVVGFDCRYTGRQALEALAKNDVRVALLWDFVDGGMVGVLTGTDLLRLLADHKSGIGSAESVNVDKESSISVCECGEDVLEKPLATTLYACARSKKIKKSITSVGCEASLRTALSLLLSNRCHRLPVINSKTGDVLYFLSKKAVLHFLMHHMSTLPTPAAFRRRLEDLRLGVWKSDSAPSEGIEEADNDETPIFSCSFPETLTEVVEKFLTSGVSVLPVFDADQRLIDSLAKYDVVQFLTSSGKEIDCQKATVEEILRNRIKGTEVAVTCFKDSSFLSALERLRKADARCLYVVDADGAFRAVMTIGDVLAFLMA